MPQHLTATATNEYIVSHYTPAWLVIVLITLATMKSAWVSQFETVI